MRFDIDREVKERNAKHRRKQRWHKRVSAMAAVVVFCTTYALILPAITMEKRMCELEEHSHSETCYVPFVERSWMEPRACSLGGHTHDDVCTAEGCEQFERIGDVDIIVHTHDDLCYDVDGSLVCDLEELELHRHTAACYRISSEQEDSDNALVEDASEPETSNQEDHVREDTIQEDTIQEDTIQEDSGSAERGSSEASSGEDVIV